LRIIRNIKDVHDYLVEGVPERLAEKIAALRRRADMVSQVGKRMPFVHWLLQISYRK
jgi:hypothetical protein